MSNSFKNRVFGCAIIKSINSNYNADFSHQPRTLPDGTVYATDKVLKYSVRNYWKKMFPDEKVFYFKSLTDDMSPRTLDETYVKFFGEFEIEKGKTKNKGKNNDSGEDSSEDSGKKVNRLPVLSNLLKCLDIRLFGATYAGKTTNISIHGTCQITHGVNKFKEGLIYSEQIMSPFKNPGEKNADSTMTTLGSQSKLQEGHYVHHFSVNPRNIENDVERVKSEGVTTEDIEKLKEGLRRGVTYYDSSAKAGTENELLLWVQLKESSKAVLPSFVELVSINEKREIDLEKVTAVLQKEHIKSEIEKIEIYYQKGLINVINEPNNATFIEL